ncbi:hypothetical protein CMI38_05075 [Candidatus Pacearchaeota archaeon]|nr:hypothetical protein [Candidatus Pacearchaeota archaeon]|tara:strand:- start:2372 stop:4462 length:2091 start_codon:yes stop_codon:yes gene_type:complete
MRKISISLFVLFILSSPVLGLEGDFDGNCKIDFNDFLMFAQAFGNFNEEKFLNVDFDLNDDKRITINDFFIFADDLFGEECELFILSESQTKAIDIRGTEFSLVRVGTEKVLLEVDGNTQVVSRGQVIPIGEFRLVIVDFKDKELTMRLDPPLEKLDFNIPLPDENILEIPLPKNPKCFRASLEKEYWNLPECKQYFKEIHYSYGIRYKHVCPRSYDPVYDSNGVFYPSSCWAEELGAVNYESGYSERMLKFISDLWETPKQRNGISYKAPNPNIEFSYIGSISFKAGTFLRSTLWEDDSHYSVLDFNVDTNQGPQHSTSVSRRKSFFPVYGERLKSLLVFVMFDDAYPEDILLSWTKRYEYFLNDYIKKKQNVDNPIQYEFFPVVIEPPEGIEEKSLESLEATNEDLWKIYNAAIEKINQNDFQVFIISPVVIKGFGGAYSTLGNMQHVRATLNPPESYSGLDKQKGINALAAFQHLFGVISHEILHALGLAGDHFPMGYGTESLNWGGFAGVGSCDFLGSSPDYYAVKLPENLKIFVGQEPDWLRKRVSSSGPCLFGAHNNEVLKDYDQDGEYEIMHDNNLIGIELQRTLGWVDIDGDGITELIDPDPYGGFEEIVYENNKKQLIGPFSFQPIYEIVIDNCKFEKVKLENGIKGLVPIDCKEFIDVDLYLRIRYLWEIVDTKYGKVLLARLPIR